MNAPKPTNPPVYLDEKGTPRTTSRDVAVQFGKNHQHVLRDIDALIGSCPNLDGLTFQRVSAFDEKANRILRSFTMDRDGWALLVMGWTGPAALKFKLAFLA